MLNTLLVLSTEEKIGIGVGVGAAVLLIIILFIIRISLGNKLLRLKNQVEEAWSTIDIHLKKRYDLIPNLVETVKGYAKHESGTLEAVIQARNIAISAKTTGEKIDAENALSGTLKSLFKLQEAYPQLKANQNFMDLQRQMRDIEDEISAARRYYNAVVREFNTRLEVFPSNIVARRMRLEKQKYFELDSEEERKNVKVQF
ncbi:MAG: LemA family protein [Clostridia bacterium]|nr:LemA family protein [Clostridia bacterium]